MDTLQTKLLFLLRVALGWLHFYAGITKVLNPDWTSAGYLANAKTFSGFYAWLASPSILPVTDFLNEWGLTLVGAALIAGLFTRFAAKVGAVMMLLYFFPVLAFPYVGEHSFIIDDHIIHILSLLLLASFQAGRIWGLDGVIGKRMPKVLRPLM